MLPPNTGMGNLGVLCAWSGPVRLIPKQMGIDISMPAGNINGWDQGVVGMGRRHGAVRTNGEDGLGDPASWARREWNRGDKKVREDDRKADYRGTGGTRRVCTGP